MTHGELWNILSLGHIPLRYHVKCSKKLGCVFYLTSVTGHWY